jgi:hypothetical protein
VTKLNKYELQCWNCGEALLVPVHTDEEFSTYIANINYPGGFHCKQCNKEYFKAVHGNESKGNEKQYPKDAWVLIEGGKWDCWRCNKEGLKEIYHNEQMMRDNPSGYNPREFMCRECFDKYWDLARNE